MICLSLQSLDSYVHFFFATSRQQDSRSVIINKVLVMLIIDVVLGGIANCFLLVFLFHFYVLFVISFSFVSFSSLFRF